MATEKKDPIRGVVACCPICGACRSEDEKQAHVVYSWATTHATLHRVKREK